MHKMNKTALSAALVAAMGMTTSAHAAIIYMDWDGLFTMLGTNGQPFANSSAPYVYDPTWSYGRRTPISGTMQFDTYTGEGSGTVVPFDFFGNNGLGPVGAANVVDMQLQAIGDGFGGPGTLILGNMLFNWGGGGNGIPVSIVLDAAGLFGAMMDSGFSTGTVISGVGALPASDGVKNNSIPIGPAPIATTGWDTTTINCIPGGGGTGDCMGVVVTGGLPLLVGATFATGNLAGQQMGGSPMVAGPFEGNMINFDFTTMIVTPGPHPPPEIPVPAAAWLFGSGLIGLIGVARRKAAR